jgi:hypothetical protein
VQRRGASIIQVEGDFAPGLIEPERIWYDEQAGLCVYGTAETFRRVAAELEAGRLPAATRGQRKDGILRIVCSCGRSSDLDPVRQLFMGTGREVTV